MTVGKQHDLVVGRLVGGVAGRAVWRWRRQWRRVAVVWRRRRHLRRHVAPTTHVVGRARAVTAASQEARPPDAAVCRADETEDDGEDENRDAEHTGCRQGTWTLTPAPAYTTYTITLHYTILQTKKGKGRTYPITELRVPELILVLGSQPAGDVSRKPCGRLPLLSARSTVPHNP